VNSTERGVVRRTLLEAGQGASSRPTFTHPNPFKCFKTSPETIRLVVMRYIRFKPSARGN
jgi:hypothetical protein